MTILSLTPVEIVDIGGATARYKNDVQAFGGDLMPGTIQDLGLVTYEGKEFYATVYYPPTEEE